MEKSLLLPLRSKISDHEDRIKPRTSKIPRIPESNVEETPELVIIEEETYAILDKKDNTSYENSSIDSTQEADDNYYIIQNTSNISEDSASFSLGIFYKRKLLQ